jgi:hypothetical protein
MSSRPHRSRRPLANTLLAVVIAGLLLLAQYMGWIPSETETLPQQAAPQRGIQYRSGSLQSDDTARIAEAFRQEESGIMVQVTGTVQSQLSDDEEGSRHQRFVLELHDGQTLLVAHNIDLAKRVPLADGDRVTLKGQYEWNDKGGVLHWTHHDPGGQHPGGWILHRENTYE